MTDNHELNEKKSPENPYSTSCLNDLNDLGDLNDFDKNEVKEVKKDKSVIKSIGDIKDFQDYFKNQGNKEHILWYLYDKVGSASDIDSKLELGVNITQKVIDRNEHFFELDHKEGKKKLWRLSDEGKRFVETQIALKQQREEDLKKQESLLKNVKGFPAKIDYEYSFNQIIKDLDLKPERAKLEDNVIELDILKLSEIDPQLTDAFLDEWEITKEKFQEYLKEKHEDDFEIRPINLPDACYIDLEKLSSKYEEKLIKTKAVVEFRSDSKEGIALKTMHECISCGAIITLRQNEDLYKEPKRCSCGHRGNFRYLGKHVDDFLEVIVRNKDITKTRTRMYLEIRGVDQVNYFNNNLGNGKVVEIVGVYKIKQKTIRNKKMNRFTGFVFSESISASDEDTVSFDVTDKDLEEIKQIGKNVEREGIHSLKKSIFPSSVSAHKGQEVLHVGWILQMVAGKNEYTKNHVKARKKPHIYVMGDPATNKSRSIAYAQKIDPRIRDVNGASTSSAGLLLGMDKFEDKRFVSGGVLAEANNSIVIVDEIQKFDKEARGALHDVLASQRLKYNKVGFNISEDIDISMSFFGNPKFDTFNNEPIYTQIRNVKDNFGNPDPNDAFLSRADLVIGIRDKEDAKTDEEIARVKMKNYSAMDEFDDTPYTLDIIRKFISHAKNNFSPQLCEESKEAIVKAMVNMRRVIKSYKVTHRMNESYFILSECFAKLRLSDNIELIDVKRAHALILDSLQSLEIEVSADLYNMFELMEAD